MAFNWQQKGWPNATVNRAALKDELDAFGAAFSRVKAALRKPQNPVALMSALVDEAVKTSAIEGVRVDESVVVSSICKALGIGDVPVGFTKDARAEGVAQMVLAVRRDWTDWAKFFIPVLSETLSGFLSAARFISAKGAYLSMYEGWRISERAKAVILRMFRDGPAGVAAGLSAAKWMRMTKVSKPTATRDLAELAKTGAILAEGNGAQTRYRLAFDLDSHEPIDEPLNEPLNEPKDEGINEGTKRDVHALVRKSPGTRVPFIVEALGVSRATVKRALAALIAAGKVEHRGSKKTGGYFCIPRLRNGSVRPPTSYLP